MQALRRFSTVSLKEVAKAHPEVTGVAGNKHHSNAQELVNKIAPIKVKGSVAVCDGGGGVLGHPVEYIQLATKTEGKPQVCKYCGLRYVHDHHHGGGH